ncbi:MAG: hypothetical protein WCQ48_07875, partial [Chloroflexota bacterium]
GGSSGVVAVPARGASVARAAPVVAVAVTPEEVAAAALPVDAAVEVALVFEVVVAAEASRGVVLVLHPASSIEAPSAATSAAVRQRRGMVTAVPCWVEGVVDCTGRENATRW